MRARKFLPDEEVAKHCPCPRDVNLQRLLWDLMEAGVTLASISRITEIESSALRHVRAKGRNRAKNVVQHWRMVEAVLRLHGALCRKK